MVKRKKPQGSHVDTGNVEAGSGAATFTDLQKAEEEAVARYLADMIEQLESIARAHNHLELAQSLATAKAEAAALISAPVGAPDKRSTH